MILPSPLQIRLVKLTEIVALPSLILLSGTIMMAQNQPLEEKLIALKQNQEANKQKLAQYTWQETETISVKGSVKDTKVYQVQIVNGQQQKTETSNQQAPPGPSEGARRRQEEAGIPGVRPADRRARQTVHHAGSRPPDAGQRGRQHLAATRRWRCELGYQELRKTGRLGHLHHRPPVQAVAERARSVVPE